MGTQTLVNDSTFAKAGFLRKHGLSFGKDQMQVWHIDVTVGKTGLVLSFEQGNKGGGNGGFTGFRPCRLKSKAVSLKYLPVLNRIWMGLQAGTEQSLRIFEDFLKILLYSASFAAS